jgi:hypothetical protein
MRIRRGLTALVLLLLTVLLTAGCAKGTAPIFSDPYWQGKPIDG